MSAPSQCQHSSYQGCVFPGVRRKLLLRELVPKASKSSKGDHVEKLYTISDGWASKDYDGIAKEVEGALNGLRQKRAQEALERSVGHGDTSISAAEDQEQAPNRRLRFLGRRGSATNKASTDSLREGNPGNDDGQGAIISQQDLSSSTSQSRRLSRGKGHRRSKEDESVAEEDDEEGGNWDGWIVEPLPEGSGSSRGLKDNLVLPGLQRKAVVDEEAEALRRRSNRLRGLTPFKIKKLQEYEVEAAKENKNMTKAEIVKRKQARQRHSQLRIISGTVAGRKLFSPMDKRVRPMMEKVRGALFSMLLSQSGDARFPNGMRWLDLYAGTGAIGLESMSRGCEQAHFVECDAWTICKCLKPNIDAANFQSSSVVHTDRVEEFLKRSTKMPTLAGGPFQFVSVTPPYMAVSYPEIYDLLEATPLVTAESVVMVEYSKQNKRDIRSSIGPLQLVKDRKYGRTFLAIYAAAP